MASRYAPLPLLTVIGLCLGAGVASAQPGGLSCVAERGAAAAKVLVDRCTNVSPATHPPCNARNPCDLIIDEIRRGCGFLHGADSPNFCRHPAE